MTFRRGHPWIEPWRRTLIGPWLSKLGYDFQPNVPEWEHRPTSPAEQRRFAWAAAEALGADLAAAGLSTATPLVDLVGAFREMILESPVRQKHGGNGFNGALTLFVLLRAIDPALIVESGVFRGFTTWVARRAAPAARILCFDPVLSQRWHIDPEATYSDQDWASAALPAFDPARAVAFFDDHIDQGRRILEAAERGFRHLIFDDDAPAHQIHAHGGPAHPTVTMLLSGPPPTEPVTWLRNGRRFEWRPDASMVEKVRDRVASWRNMDDLHRATGYSPARMTYVRLKDR